jgi:hypothetical protein
MQPPVMDVWIIVDEKNLWRHFTERPLGKWQRISRSCNLVAVRFRTHVLQKPPHRVELRAKARPVSGFHRWVELEVSSYCL